MHRHIELFRPSPPSTFGTARLACVPDLRKAKMLAPLEGKHLGPIIGAFTPDEIGGREKLNIFANGEGHLLSLSPTGGGKTGSQIITNLLWWPESAVVTDYKGEVWRHTAGWRQSQGHRVIRFAPFEQGSDTLNPLDYINKGCGQEPITPNHPVRQENARYLANLMITPNPKSHEPYFDHASKSLLQGMMLHVATADLVLIEEDRKDASRVRERTMGEVRRLLALDTDGFMKLLRSMAASEENWVRETAGTMNQMAAAREQNAAVRTVLLEHTTIWAYQRVQAVTASSSFSFDDLRGDTPTTVYLIIPFEVLSEYRVLLRVLIGLSMQALRTSWIENGKNSPVLLFLDEFPQLGYMQPIEDALLYIRSYGVKFWFFVQDIAQLKHHYEKTWTQFFANCATRMFFGVSDIDTAKLVSEMSGQATVMNRSYAAGFNESDTIGETYTSGTSSQSGPGGSSSGSFSSTSYSNSRTKGTSFTANAAHTGRALLMPDEILRLPFGTMIAFFKGMNPVRARLRYWREMKPAEGMLLPPSSDRS